MSLAVGLGFFAVSLGLLGCCVAVLMLVGAHGDDEEHRKGLTCKQEDDRE